jgi:hypothetical protein
MTPGSAPEAVKQIVGRIVDTALAQCDRAGIAHEDFYVTFTSEMEAHPRDLLERVIALTFAQLLAQRS